MHDLCPLCLKRGTKKNIKLLQINLQEAVWMCEEEKCLWPFGYKDVEFSQRIVGEIWSCYWKDYKPTTLRSKENPLVPIKTSLCEILTDPESKSTSEELITNVDVHCTENIVTSNSTNVTNPVFVSDELSASIPEKLDTSFIKTEISNDEDDNILRDTITINNVHLCDSNSQLVDNNEDIKIKTEAIDLLNIDTEGKDDVSLKSVKNIRETPKITSIQKTEINIANAKTANTISVYQDSGQKLLKAKKPVNIKGSAFISKPKRLLHSEPIKNNDTVSKSNLSVTKVEIDGLPPITLAYEIPEFTTIPETISNLKLYQKTNNAQSINTEIKSTFEKRNLNSGKHYEKFSFNAIKKKIESSNATDNSNNSSSIKTNSGTRDTECHSINDNKKKDNSNNSNIANNNNRQATVNVNTNVDTTCISNQVSNSVTCLSSQENVVPVTEAVNTSANIDSLLEDLLANDHSVPEDINDDWLDSLLN